MNDSPYYFAAFEGTPLSVFSRCCVKETTMELDPVLVAGTIDTDSINYMAGNIEGIWPATLIATLSPYRRKPHTPSGHGGIPEEEWCGIRASSIRSEATTAPARSNPLYSKHLDQLCHWKVLTELPEYNVGNRVWSRFFEVAKKDGTARAIFDCRGINALAAEPPPLRLVDPEVLFKLLGFFKDPSMATADFRHFFYQIVLPSQVRHWFSVGSHRGKAFEMDVFPMGFSWSPLVGQAVTMSIVHEACRGVWRVEDPDPGTASPPPFWILRNNTNKIVAFIIGYYDNVMTIAVNAVVRDQIMSRFVGVCGSSGAALKGDITATSKAGDTIEFLGLDVAVRDHIPSWRHCAANKSRWVEMTHPTTYRALAEWLGVATWNWLVSGKDLGTMTLALRMASTVGRMCPDAHQWDTPVDDAMVAAKDISTLISALRAELALGMQVRKVVSAQPSQVVYIATDATLLKGAFIIYEDVGDVKQNTTMMLDWKEEQMSNRSINWYETKTALRSIDHLLRVRPLPINAEVRICVDNSTCRFALSKGYFSGCDELNNEVVAMKERLRDLGVTLHVVQVKSRLQAADEATRGRETDPLKLQYCLDRMRRSGSLLEWMKPVRSRE